MRLRPLIFECGHNCCPSVDVTMERLRPSPHATRLLYHVGEWDCMPQFLKKGVRSEVCCCAYMPFELSVKFQENEETTVFWCWVCGVCSFLGCLKKFPSLRLDPTVLYNVLFLDFSRVMCDRLSVHIMYDRFTLISKLIGIVVRFLQIFRCDAFRC